MEAIVNKGRIHAIEELWRSSSLMLCFGDSLETGLRDVKRLVGSRFSDSQVQEEIKSWPFKNLKETVEVVRARIPRMDTLLDEFTLGGIPPAPAASIYNVSGRRKAQKQDESRVESGTKDRSKDEDFDKPCSVTENHALKVGIDPVFQTEIYLVFKYPFNPFSNSICVGPSFSTPNPVRIIPGPAGLVQRAKLLKENVFILDPDEALMLTQEYMQKVIENVGEDGDFNSGAWVSATNYMNAFGGTVTGCLGDINNFLKKGKLEQVVAIVKSCSLNALGDLNVTLKDLSGITPRTIHYKVLDLGNYEKDITVGAAMILANVSVFTPKPSKHYLNITKRNVVEVFRKDTVSLA
ncbi:hypothetical protein Tco_1316553 [Tanacetum coccineum]